VCDAGTRPPPRSFDPGGGTRWPNVGYGQLSSVLIVVVFALVVMMIVVTTTSVHEHRILAGIGGADRSAFSQALVILRCGVHGDAALRIVATGCAADRAGTIATDRHKDLIGNRVGGDRVRRRSRRVRLVGGIHAHVRLQSAGVDNAEQLRSGG